MAADECRRTSAGLLLFRDGEHGLEVLLGHMGGPFWVRKEAGAWTIPKGEPSEGEDLHDAAVREFAEEVGLAPPPGVDLPLGAVVQRAGKSVTVWARRGELDAGTAVSNSFEMEWPPRSGRPQSFPELDRLAWVPVEQARDLLVTAQVELVDRLLHAVGPAAGTPGDTGG